MKNRKTIRCLLLLTVMAAGSSAQAQSRVILAKGATYTIKSASAATSEGGAAPKYQWYRNGEAIPFATAASYTVPVANAEGTNVEFKRKAYLEGCGEDAAMYSNTVTITWCPNLLLDGVCWADANVDGDKTFATQPDMHTKYYKWNNLTAYSATDPVSPSWSGVTNTSERWSVNPCPEGWQLPSREDFESLIASGTSWATAGEKGNSVEGRFFGANHATCTLPSNMASCIFLPASGMRDPGTGALSRASDGRYWSSTQATTNTGNFLNFGVNSYNIMDLTKGRGFNVRCVQ